MTPDENFHAYFSGPLAFCTSPSSSPSALNLWATFCSLPRESAVDAAAASSIISFGVDTGCTPMGSQHRRTDGQGILKSVLISEGSPPARSPPGKYRGKDNKARERCDDGNEGRRAEDFGHLSSMSTDGDELNQQVR